MKKSQDIGWIDVPYKLYTDTLTIFPAPFTGDGSAISVWSISGNCYQASTPTPDNPVDVEECGELVESGEHAGQYKLPLTANGVEYPIYLGEAETTRKIKKLVFTGKENWRLAKSGGFFVYSNIHDYYRVTGVKICLLTHYIAQPNFNSNSQVIDKHAGFYSNPTTIYDDFYIRDSDYETASEFKAYLAAQYAAGTPVTVWYVLAEPEIAVVNEPLRKIGNYADTIDSTQTTVQIPTFAGSNTLDFGTTLKPSMFEGIDVQWVDREEKKRVNGEWI